MNERQKPELMADDNPDWTAEEVARAKPFSALPKALQTKLRGRPKAASVKERLTIRVEPEALALWRASGKGWQTRAAALMSAKAPKIT